MNKTRLFLAAAMSLSFLAFAAPAGAATAHNLQTGADTKNVNDSGQMSSHMRMMHMKKMKMKKHMKMM